MSERTRLTLDDFRAGADADPAVAARKSAFRRGSEGHFEEMIATRRFPGLIGTDGSFMEARPLDGSQFTGASESVGRDYVRRAVAAGVNPTGKYYFAGLARFPGDPRAWVDGRDHVQRVCTAEGWTATGAVNVAAPQYADGYVPPAKYRVADDIVAREVNAIAAAMPGPVDREAVADAVTTLRSGVHGS